MRSSQGFPGAAIALHGGLSGINGAEWLKVVYGLGLSTLLGFFAGFLSAKTTQFACRNVDRRKANRFFRYAQIGGGATMAFMHGAAGWAEVHGGLHAGDVPSGGQSGVTSFVIPLWLMILCSAVMALGTSIGGLRIIKAVGHGYGEAQ